MNEELKPCPFCGCFMEIQAVGRDWYDLFGFHEKLCILENFGCMVPQISGEREALARDWNKRA